MHRFSHMKPTLISMSEAAEILQIDRSTLSRWVAFGHIKPAFRLSPRGPMVFDKAAVKSFAKKRAA